MSKKSASPRKATPAKAAPAKKAPAKKTAAKKTVSKKTARKTTSKSSPSSPQIAIRALVDVGFGNHLYIRGEGAGLSWDVGQPMACLGSSEWQWTSSSGIRPILFKVLINDQIWSVGDDYVASPGEITVVEPGF